MFRKPPHHWLLVGALQDYGVANHSLNIDLLLRIRDRVATDLQGNVVVGVYDEPIRFNLTFVDDDVCIAQPYLPAVRGVDSPTLLMRRSAGQGGLYETFERVFDWVQERSSLL